MFSRFFIDRPRFACVIAIVTMLAGIIALRFLPVTQYPNITPSQIRVSATYPGANAETVQKTVIAPIEEQLNGVKGMLYMSSTASDAGTAAIVVTFGIGTNGDSNTVNVQNRVNWATPQLPEEVRNQGVVVKEQNSNMLMAVTLTSPNGTRSALQLNNYARNYLTEELARIPGVGDVQNLGELRYAMRVWLDPQRMAGLNVTADDVAKAIRAQNVQVAAGAIGERPIAAGQIYRYTIQTKGRLSTVDDFEKIIVRSNPDGANIRIKDIATVELAAEKYSTQGWVNRKNAALMVIYQLSDANGLAIAARVRETMDRLKKDFPGDMEYNIQYDTTRYVSSSIHEVVKTLIEAVVLVILITFLFLGDWRSTLIPSVAIPVSLIGTFAVLYLIGYSVNTITLFGLILAIGVVVDDAILVIENVNRLMHDEHLAPRDAAIKTMVQVSGAVVATTLVLLAMFLPICFLGGITGEIYRQFGITISVAVVLSSVNALTLSPALSALILVPVEKDHQKFILFRYFDKYFASFTNKYVQLVQSLIRKLVLVVILVAVIFGLGIRLYTILPKGFIPDEDKGAFFIHVQLPDAAAMTRTIETVKRISAKLEKRPGVDTVISVAGFNLLGGTVSSNCGLLIVSLIPWEERRAPNLSQEAIMKQVSTLLKQEREARAIPFGVPALPGVGGTSGFSFVLEDLTGTHPEHLAQAGRRLMAAANQDPRLMQAFTTFTASEPKIFLKIDRQKALEMGVPLANINNALQAFAGQTYVNDFNKFGKVYRVWLEGIISARSNVTDLDSIYVRNDTGEMVPLSTLVDVERQLGPQYLQRYNMRSSLLLMGSGAPGVSSGEAMQAMEEIADNILPTGMTYDWTNMSYQEKIAGGRVVLIFILSILFIYFFLVAQYESWTIPGGVMLAIPIAFFGAVLYLWVMERANDIYSQVGLVLLFGISAKTSILIVEFAKTQHEEGKSIVEAAAFAAKLRFRAVLMTAISFIFGTMPLVISVGAGAASRKSMGMTVVGGMTLSCILGPVLVPGIFVIIQKIVDSTRQS
ncbi:MAG: multidrug efflux RND transporter permease subunit [Victivallaceae bacterium]|nr:multidrug efflux RND transporter permease subunit [Victivallaceae bacterium]